MTLFETIHSTETTTWSIAKHGGMYVIAKTENGQSEVVSDKYSSRRLMCLLSELYHALTAQS